MATPISRPRSRRSPEHGADDLSCLVRRIDFECDAASVDRHRKREEVAALLFSRDETGELAELDSVGELEAQPAVLRRCARSDVAEHGLPTLDPVGHGV